MSHSARTVVREPRFERELDQLEPNPRKADLRFEGLEHILSRAPEKGVPVAHDGNVEISMIQGLFGRYNERVAIFYTFCEKQGKVWLLSIRRRTPNGAA